jgi:hypothetical protein
MLPALESLLLTDRRSRARREVRVMEHLVIQQRFVTRKTVEAHLGHVYRKLDIGSRDGLAAALEL